MHVYVLGGFDQSGSVISNVECSIEGRWREIEPMLEPQGYSEATSLGGSIIVVSDCNGVGRVEIFRRKLIRGDGQWFLTVFPSSWHTSARMAGLMPSSVGLVALSRSTLFCFGYYP